MDYWTGLCFLNILNVVFTTADMFYTVHLDKSAFAEAQESCIKLDKGFLTNMENQGEIAKILRAIGDKKDENTTLYWIGLTKKKDKCVQTNLPLMGFSWIRGNSPEFDASTWKSEPPFTCTGELCALLSLTYKGSTTESWQLVSSSCRHKYPFICKHEGQREQWPCPYPTMQGKADIMQKHQDPYTLQVTCNSGDSFTLTCSQSTRTWMLPNQPDTDISGLCTECNRGFRKDEQGSCVDVDECKELHVCKHECVNTPGSYKCKCSDIHGLDGKDSEDNCSDAGNVDPSHESSHGFQDNPTPTTRDDGRHPPSDQPESTTEGSVHIDGNTGDLSNIIITVIIALLIFVVLVVIIVAIVKCCLIRRSKKRAKKRAQASKESMALNGSDSMEKVSDSEVI